MKKADQAFLETLMKSKAIDLAAIKTLQGKADNAQKSKFKTTIELSAYVKKANDWFEGEDGKAAMEEANVRWTKEDFARNTFGWQRSFYYKLVKVGSLPPKKIESFVSACDKAEEKGEVVGRTVESLLKFAKGKTKTVAKQEVKIDFKIQTQRKVGGIKTDYPIKVKIYADGGVSTNRAKTPEDIIQALELVKEQLQEYFGLTDTEKHYKEEETPEMADV